MARKWSDKQIKNAEKAIKKALEAAEDASCQVVINTDDLFTKLSEEAEQRLRAILTELGRIS